MVAQLELKLRVAALRSVGIALAFGLWEGAWRTTHPTENGMKFIHNLRVYYEDTDMAGIVYYANYLKFAERGRSDAVRDMGIDQNDMKANGLVFAVKSVQAEYHKPAIFGDELVVETQTSKLGGASLEMSQWVRRGEDLIFSAVFRVACMDAGGKAARFPAEIRQKLQESMP